MIGQFGRYRSVLFRGLLPIILSGVAVAALDRGQLRDVAASRYGEHGVRVAADWLHLLDQARSQPVSVQMSRINEFFNSRTTFASDVDVWQQADWWATPLDTLARGRGDCEDFAIAKYVSLMALGVAQNRLRLIYVRANLDGSMPGTSQAHMVLGYYADPNGEPQILDNLVGSIERASARPDLTPVFSFNGEGLWAGGVKAQSDPTARLSRWRDLLVRLKNEGFQ
ncbi:MAG: transglutaminase-like cysteine peptidase [Panacagrimonas sp.]